MPRSFTRASAARARHIAVRANGDVFVAMRDGELVALRDSNGDGVADEVERRKLPITTGLEIHNPFLYFSDTVSVSRLMLDDNLMPAGEPETIVEDFPATGLPRHQVHCPERSRRALRQRRRTLQRLPEEAPLARLTGPRSLPAAGTAGRHLEIQCQPPEPGCSSTASGSSPAPGTWWPWTGTTRSRRCISPCMAGISSPPSGPITTTTQPAPSCRPRSFTGPCPAATTAGPPPTWTRANGKTPAGTRVRRRRQQGSRRKLPGAPARLSRPLGTERSGLLHGEAFPEAYRGGAFIAWHGSWNRAPMPQDGYRITFQPFADGTVAGPPEDFMTGFKGRSNLQRPSNATWRPTGLAGRPGWRAVRHRHH